MTIDPHRLAASLGYDPTDPVVKRTVQDIGQQSLFTEHPLGRKLVLKRAIVVLPDTLSLTEARRWFNEGRCSYEEVLAYWPRWAKGKTEYRWNNRPEKLHMNHDGTDLWLPCSVFG